MLDWFWWIFLPFAPPGKLTPEENARLAKTCGAGHRSVPKMFGAEKLMIDEYPWMTILNLEPGLCTGTLISPRHILTAAHCVTLGVKRKVEQKKCPERKFCVRPEVMYYLGGNKCTDYARCDGWKTAYKVHYHEQYDGCTHVNDIAIIELDENVPESEATPICMPTRYQAINTGLIAVGAGSRGPNITEISQSPVGLQELNVTFLQTRNKVIDVLLPLKAGICPGDSGGALIQTNSENKFMQLGVTSYSTSCANHFKYSKITYLPPTIIGIEMDTFTDVRKYLDWICEKTGVCQEDNGIDQGDFQSSQ